MNSKERVIAALRHCEPDRVSERRKCLRCRAFLNRLSVTRRGLWRVGREGSHLVRTAGQGGGGLYRRYLRLTLQMGWELHPGTPA